MTDDKGHRQGSLDQVWEETQSGSGTGPRVQGGTAKTKGKKKKVGQVQAEEKKGMPLETAAPDLENGSSEENVALEINGDLEIEEIPSEANGVTPSKKKNLSRVVSWGKKKTEKVFGTEPVTAVFRANSRQQRFVLPPPASKKRRRQDKKDAERQDEMYDDFFGDQTRVPQHVVEQLCKTFDETVDRSLNEPSIWQVLAANLANRQDDFWQLLKSTDRSYVVVRQTQAYVTLLVLLGLNVFLTLALPIFIYTTNRRRMTCTGNATASTRFAAAALLFFLATKMYTAIVASQVLVYFTALARDRAERAVLAVGALAKILSCALIGLSAVAIFIVRPVVIEMLIDVVVLTYLLDVDRTIIKSFRHSQIVLPLVHRAVAHLQDSYNLARVKHANYYEQFALFQSKSVFGKLRDLAGSCRRRKLFVATYVFSIICLSLVSSVAVVMTAICLPSENDIS